MRQENGETDPKETETKGHFPQRVEVTSESVDFIWLVFTRSTTTNTNGYLGRLKFAQTAQILTALLFPDVAEGGLTFPVANVVVLFFAS